MPATPRSAIAALALSILLAAQPQPLGPQTAVPTFEVVSIKSTAQPPKLGTGTFYSPGTLTVGNYSLKRLIGEAYRLRVDGGPSWIDSDTEHWDIVAKASFPAKFTQLMDMLVPMMADRFQLRAHKETRELPGFALLVAKGGVKMTKYTKDDKVGAHSWVGNVLNSTNMNMKMLTNTITAIVSAPVVDETGLEGAWTFVFKYPPVDPKAVNPPDGAAPSPDDLAPSIFSALQDQLGLRLEKRKVPVDFIVVDHAEKPTAN